MVVALASRTDVIDAFHTLRSKKRLSEVFLLFLDLKSLNKGVLEEARALEAISWLRHKDACDGDHISGGAAAGNLTLRNDLEHTRHMTDRHLVTRLLNLDVLVGNKA